MEKENRYIVYAVFVSLFAVLFRAVIGYFKPYFIGIDGYYYLLNTVSPEPLSSEVMSWMLNYSIGWTTFLLIIAMFLTFLLSYLIARHYLNRKESLIAQALFSFSALVFLNTQFFMYDKNILSLYFIMTIYYSIIKKWNIAAFLSIIVFSLVWKGSIIMFIIFILYSILYFKKLYQRLFLFFSLILLSITGISYFPILNNTKSLIQETMFLWQTYLYPEYIIIFAVIMFILLYHAVKKFNTGKFFDNKDDYFLIGYFIVFSIMTIYMFRFIIFLLPVMYIVYILYARKLYFSYYWIAAVCAVLLIIASFNVYTSPSTANDAMVAAVLYANRYETDCLIGDWGKGHIYQFYSNKNVLYKGSAGHVKEQIDYMLRGNETDCVLIWEDRDIITTKYAADHYNISYDNVSYIETLDSYTVRDSKNNTFHLHFTQWDTYNIKIGE